MSGCLGTGKSLVKGIAGSRTNGSGKVTTGE